ncbi:MAG: hypothetical protein WD598_15870 [Acidimicrobiia bacterium]
MTGPEPLRGRWEAFDRIALADGSIPWMHGFTGAACAIPADATSPRVEVLVTGRDADNRSLIGRGVLDLDHPTRRLEVEEQPVLGLGDLGAFDENGVSYPCVVTASGETRLYYTGWMPTVLTPFQNHIGLARLGEAGRFERVSRAPILERTDADYLSMGSCFVRAEADRWLMWYTTFRGWGHSADEPKHRYVIKLATSDDGLRWVRDDIVCIDAQELGEHSISRPSVIVRSGAYHMWYCTRGDRYRIGYAVSFDGAAWTRCDDLFCLGPRQEWDAAEQCYPHVFERGEDLWMLYCGNSYGRDGLGLARFVPSG